MLPVEHQRPASSESSSDTVLPQPKPKKRDKIAKALHSLGSLFHSDKHKEDARTDAHQKDVKEVKLERKKTASSSSSSSSSKAATSSSEHTALTSSTQTSQKLLEKAQESSDWDDELDFSSEIYLSSDYAINQQEQIQEIDTLWTERWGNLQTLEKFEPQMRALVAPYQHLIPKVNPLEPSGRVFMGNYPGDHPYDTKDLGDVKLPVLLKDLGINQIVCLQKEDELIASFKPYQETALKIAKELQLEAPQFLHFGIRDVSVAPDNDVYHFVLETLLPAITKPGMKTYIHCWGGNGRTGTISAIVLAALFGLDAETALKKVNTYHKIRINPQYNAPETETQRNQVRRLVPKIVASDIERETNSL